MISNWPFIFLEIQLCILAFGLFYWLVLSQVNHNRWKRLFIIASVLFAVTIPNLNFTIEKSVMAIPMTIDLGELVKPLTNSQLEMDDQNGMSEGTIGLDTALTYFVILLLSIGAVRFIIFSIRWVAFKNKLRRLSYFDSTHQVHVTDEFEMAFAFAGSVYIPPSFYDLTNFEQQAILNHERQHVKFHHDSDKWIMNLLRIVFWANPLFHFLYKELLAVHEYEADQDFPSNYDNLRYSELLISLQSKKTSVPSLASPFSHSLIKKRVRQLNQPKSNTMKKGLFFLALPMTMLLVYAFSFRTVQRTIVDPNNKTTLQFSSPINLSKVTNYSPFGLRKDPGNSIQKMHSGLDLVAQRGTDILAAGSGTVVLVERNSTGHGLRVGISHADNFETRYSHLEEILVVAGQSVHAGDLIGKCGSTGKSSGPHLHFEVLNGNKHVDPEKHLNLRLSDFGNSAIDRTEFLVIIDPAHGGEDSGVEIAGHSEKQLSLIYAKTLQEELESMGIASILLREDDRAISLEQRSNSTFNTENALYLSLHFNQSSSDSAQGVELYVSGKEDVNQLKSKLFSEIFKQTISGDDILYPGTKTADFYVLKNSQSPAVLIELGFMSSASDLQNILSQDYRQKLCSAIAQSTNLYVN